MLVFSIIINKFESNFLKMSVKKEWWGEMSVKYSSVSLFKVELNMIQMFTSSRDSPKSASAYKVPTENYKRRKVLLFYSIEMPGTL